ncbi:hypothetical protein O6H91_08G029700 [Diphasiastrum complanatum]|uniref:Uncharacterized protein n=1 Tax=Diphasiastrum complanatum TaxID=34168 RepID=A0ACC2CW40_DIPCM|nr:hypothetical protein O6H91_08G029700 [Diphasiastrum complanatum]
MPKDYAIELYFDAALENQVLKVWNILARRQVSTLLIEIGARPHISLCFPTSTDLDQTKLRTLLESFAAQERPLAVTFTARLGIQLGGFYQPGSWFPNCPVAQELPKDRVGDAFNALRDLKLPLKGHICSIGLVDLSSSNNQFVYDLGTSNA